VRRQVPRARRPVRAARGKLAADPPRASGVSEHGAGQALVRLRGVPRAEGPPPQGFESEPDHGRGCLGPWARACPPRPSSDMRATAMSSPSPCSRRAKRGSIASGSGAPRAIWGGGRGGGGADLGGPLGGLYRIKPHLLFTWLAELVRHPSVLDAVEDVLGPDILCWNTSFFTKEARSPGFVSWHQDATYWGLSEPDVVTAWVAFTESTPANGNMRVIPGSHRAPVPHVDTFHPDNLLSRGQEIAVEVDESRAVDIVLAPGEMSLHHVLMVHGSGANLSGDRRIGFAIRYIP